MLALVSLAACGGGGAVKPPTSGGPAPAGQTAALPITVSIPSLSSQAKRPQFVSPNTQSLAIYVWAQGGSQPGAPTATINISGCPNSGGTLTCTTTVTAPIATINVRVDALSGTSGAGTVLATVTTTIAVSAGMPAVNITLNGTPSIIKLSLETPALLSGTAGTSKLDVNAYDASGALIVAPGTFSAPLTISSDSTAVTLSASTASSPATQITVSYGGGVAPYAVHLTGSGAGVVSTSIIGATLDITPAASFAVISGTYQNHLMRVTVVGSNATNEPPQNQFFLPPIANLIYFSPGSFAYLPNGTIATASYISGSLCNLQTYPAANLQSPQSITYAPPGDASIYCTVAVEPNGDILAGDGIATDDITEYSVAANGTATATGRRISLVGAQVPTSSVGSEALAVNASGQIAVLAYTGSTYYALVYAAGANGAATPQQTISLSTNGSPHAIAIASDGSVAVGFIPTMGPPYVYRVDRYTVAQTLAGSITPSTSFYGDNLNGLTFDSSNNLYVLAEQTSNTTPYNYGETLDMYPPGTFGTVTPTLSIPLTQAAGVPNAQTGPVLVPSPAPAGTPAPVSGDMMGYVPSRTWTYLVTPADNTVAPYYFGVYADPNLVNGNVRLVGFQSASSNPFSGGTLVATADFTDVNGSYFAVGYGSVSSGSAGTSGTIPGSPLFVPNALNMNSTWTPLQNQTVATLTGTYTNAQVVGGGAVPGISACPAGSATSGATVQYTIGQAMFNYAESARISYVPGCGMVSMIVPDGGTGVLQSVGSMPSLGQQTLPAGQPAIVQALHALWRATFGIRTPHKP
ncbi:MAG: hypothetical protein JOZ01_09060 [Candidatus Eremiobacteraeota bacterium]|nr:hypothetical protein [Candidatus Eremiobacteraeota bacterium]